MHGMNSMTTFAAKAAAEDATIKTETTLSNTKDNDSPSSMAFKICSPRDYQTLARSTLSTPLYEYLASGTDDEQTLHENETAFKHWYLRPRVMRPVGKISTETTLLGQRLSMPVFVSPAGVHALCDDVSKGRGWSGECSSARACGQVGTLFGVSQHSTRSIEEIAQATREMWEAGGGKTNLWYQSYILKDREMTLSLIRRAKKAGYQGVFLTVDSVRFGYREADARNGWNALPEPHRLVNYDEEVARIPSTAATTTTDSLSKPIKRWLAPDAHHVPTNPANNLSAASIDRSKIYQGENDAWDQNTEQLFEQNPTWNDVHWLKTQLKLLEGPELPLIVKGIMTGEDAIEAIQAGADGVMVSNHGGRGLDGALPAIDALPEVVAAVRSMKGVDGSKIPILLDGGVRRGSDVLKSLALGATAVGIGKPVFFALAVGGEKGVVDLLKMMQRETEAAMAICGCESVKDVTESLVTRHPGGVGRVGKYARSKL